MGVPKPVEGEILADSTLLKKWTEVAPDKVCRADGGTEGAGEYQFAIIILVTKFMSILPLPVSVLAQCLNIFCQKQDASTAGFGLWLLENGSLADDMSQ